jgi:enediyne biosynthesis protein E4
MKYQYIIISFLTSILLITSCKSDDKLFTSLSKSQTGLDFRNILEESEDLNVLNYTYFYNGGGVAVGDVNNDGLTDVLFTGNMVKNRLFINKGDMNFEDITQTSGVAEQQGWCTGATMVDINQDGWLDIYICRSADTRAEKRSNLLYINNHDNTFVEKAAEYGLDNDGYSTQASFFDYDKDGDLDMFLLNHSLMEYAGFSKILPDLKKQRNPIYGNKLYQNDGSNHFTEVSEKANIVSNVLSFGLGCAVSDYNNDGWLDIYVSNDFNEQDYLYINKHDGNGSSPRFSEESASRLGHTSLFSMGSDAADINNDGHTDLITLDMLAEDNHRQKMTSGADNYDKFKLLESLGFGSQFSRNMLHLNNGNGSFAEIGQFSGISGTDWSWSALFQDYDNDGFKDLFVTNGFVRDYTDMDFLKYTTDEQIKAKEGQEAKLSVSDLIGQMPKSEVENYVFQNDGKLSFHKKNKDWGIEGTAVSSGAAYADFDNDGDMDLVINNINEYASFYQNNSEKLSQNNYLKIKLLGTKNNPSGIGSRVSVYAGGQVYMQEQIPVRGFQSSVEQILNFGLGKMTKTDSVVVLWNNDKKQVLMNVKSNQMLSVKITEANQVFDYQSNTNRKVNPSEASVAPTPPLEGRDFKPSHSPSLRGEGLGRGELSNSVEFQTFFTENQKSLNFTHSENLYNDFKSQILLPNMLSRSGPCLAKGDVNNDGLEDLYVGGASGQSGELFLQQKNGQFTSKSQPIFKQDITSEDCDAIFFDADNDKDLDLYVVSGGNEFQENDVAMQDRLYLNDGKGNFNKSPLPKETISGSCVRPADVDNDGDLDLFIGGRLSPQKYPQSPESQILINQGKGVFVKDNRQVINNLGMVTDAVWIDLNKDKSLDLVVVGEWMPIKVFINQNGKLSDQSEAWIKESSSGFWNKILAEDFDNDGDLDLVIGNHGLNSQIKATENQPTEITFKDFDDNGTIDPIMSYYLNGKSYPFPSRDDLLEHLPMLKPKFTNYKSYADAQLSDLFTTEQLNGSTTLQAQNLQTIYLENTGKSFKMKTLPIQAQFSPVYAITSTDVNADGKKDIILGGNLSTARIKFGKYDASLGTVLLGDGKGNFQNVPASKTGLNLKGDVRNMVMVGKKLVVGVNNDKVRVFGL